MTDARTSYNAWSATYDTVENPTRDLGMQVLRRTIEISRDHDVVEIGCGTGLNTVWLAERARSVVALDFSDGMLAQARIRATASNVNFRLCDLRRRWPVDDRAADVIVCALVLEHIADLLPVFAEASRVLRPDGRLFVAEYHPLRQELGKKANFTQAHDGQRVEIEAYIHAVADYENALRRAGLTVMRCENAFDADAALDATPRLVVIHAQKQGAGDQPSANQVLTR